MDSWDVLYEKENELIITQVEAVSDLEGGMSVGLGIVTDGCWAMSFGWWGGPLE